jgi:ABC-type multidrug transport system fused ATPase/permease subunit
MADYDLDAGEYVIRRINRYWADLISVIVAAIFITLAAIFGEIVYSQFRDVIPFITPNIAFAIFTIMIIVVILMLLSGIYVYVHNYLVITNVHLIKVEQAGIIARETSQLGLGHIQDVKGRREGILGFFLDYGNVEIQTAGAQENFVFRTAHRPQLLADELLQYETDFNDGKLPPPPAGP